MSERLSGRITNVWTEEVSTTLAAAAAVSATTLTVDDASIFNDDTETDEAGNLGYLRSGSQVVGYTDVSDETGVVTLADPLTVAADEDDAVTVWSDLYGEPDTRQWASVQPEGGDRADDIDAIVDDGLELVDGDRGRRGEACTLFRETGSDVWEVRGPLGRPSKASGMKAEAHDAYTLTAADVTAGTATFPLTYPPIDESVKLTLGTVPQEPTNYTVDRDAATITFPLGGWESVGLRFSVHYWYVRGLVAATVPPAATPYATAVMADNPLAYWRLGETSGTVADDSTSNNRDATYVGAVTLGATGILASEPTHKAAQFALDAAQAVSVTSAAWMDVSTLTVEALVKFLGPIDTTNGDPIVSRYHVGGYLWMLYRNYSGSSRLTGLLSTPSGATHTVAATLGTIDDGTVYHVAMTYDGASTLKLYANGTGVGSQTLTGGPGIYPGSSPIEVARYSQAAATVPNAVVSDVAIYGQALSGSQIAAHYTASLP